MEIENVHAIENQLEGHSRFLTLGNCFCLPEKFPFLPNRKQRVMPSLKKRG